MDSLNLREQCVYTMWAMGEDPAVKKLYQSKSIDEIGRLADDIVSGKLKTEVARRILAEAVAARLEGR